MVKQIYAIKVLYIKRLEIENERRIALVYVLGMNDVETAGWAERGKQRFVRVATVARPCRSDRIECINSAEVNIGG